VARLIVLLRGVNLGSRNRVAMPALREALEDIGYDDVRSYVQSGNVVLSSRRRPKRVAADVQDVIAERFGLSIDVVVRTRDELAAVVRRNPLGNVATEPKRYQVSFLEAAPKPAVVKALADAAVGDERFAHIGRELYAWHPDGIARSKLWARLASPNLGVTATARNWATVTALLALADEE
jgi:uncharacterized protein (DUF1697 family)